MQTSTTILAQCSYVLETPLQSFDWLEQSISPRSKHPLGLHRGSIRGRRGGGCDVVEAASALHRRDDNDANHDDHNHGNNQHHLHVLPPHLPLQGPSLLFELCRPLLQRICAGIKFGELLIPLQDLLNIHTHDSNYRVDLCLGLLHALLGSDLLGGAGVGGAQVSGVVGLVVHFFEFSSYVFSER